ncbi:hypothetical protein FS842_000050 [Serendipita sp. 407]|nr:hypothetical protein FS842_000050 [Serendipita sp. 407]
MSYTVSLERLMIAAFQSFSAPFRVSRTSHLWWRNDFPISKLASVKPMSSYSLTEIRSAAISACRTHSRIQNRYRFMEQSPHSSKSIKGTNRIMGSLSPGGYRSDLRISDYKLQEPPTIVHIPVDENRHCEEIARNTPYLFYIQFPYHQIGTRPTIVCVHLRRGEICGRWEVPILCMKHKHMDQYSLAMKTLTIDHQTVRLALLAEEQADWYRPVLRLVDVHMDECASPYTFGGNNSVNNMASESHIIAQFSLVLELQLSSLQERHIGVPILATYPFSSDSPGQLWVDPAETPKGPDRYGKAPDSNLFLLNHELVCWIQYTPEPSALPLVTCVKYRKSSTRPDGIDLEIGRWILKDHLIGLYCAKLVSIPTSSAILEYVLCVIGLSKNPKLFTIPVSLVFSTPYIADEVPVGQPGAENRPYGCFDLHQTIQKSPTSNVSPSMNLWNESSYKDPEGYFPDDLRLAFDPEIEAVTLHGIPMELQRKIKLTPGSLGVRERDPMASYIYKLRAVAVSNSYGASPAHIWRYEFYLHAYSPVDSNTDGLPDCLSTWVHIPQPSKGIKRWTYALRFGMDYNVAWLVTLGSSSLLFLQTYGTGSNISRQNKRVQRPERRGRGTTPLVPSSIAPASNSRKELELWALAQVENSEFGLVDLRAGVACAFSDFGMTRDSDSPVISVHWFD